MLGLPLSLASRSFGFKTVRSVIIIFSGVVVNFDLVLRFPRPMSQQRGSLCPCARRVAVLGVGAGGGRPLPLSGSGGVNPG